MYQLETREEKMNKSDKGIYINHIINTLNDKIKSDNKILCSQNRHSEQTAIHGGDMFFKLAFMSDKQINKIAKACGL